MAINNVTLGDDQPLDNNLKPIKVGGEASIINVSSPTPDGSVDGEVEVKGNFKAKDTAIEGNFSATSIENVPQFNFHSRNNISARLDVQASANQTSSIRIRNNQGYFDIKRLYSTTSLQFTDGTNTPLTLDGTNVGIGTTSPITPLHIESTNNALADNDEPENCHLLLRNAANDTNEGVGLGFLISSQTDDVGASIIYKRKDSAAKGELHFNVKTNTDSDGAITQAMTIDAQGDVGIGTTSPSVELEVNGDIKANELTLDGTDAGITITNTGAIEMHFDAGTGHAANITSNNAIYMLAGSSKKLHFGANNTNSQMALDDGKVGIGTTSPDYLLEIEGSDDIYTQIKSTGSNSDAGLKIKNDAQEWRIYNWGATSDVLNFRAETAGNSVLTMQTDGKVGIGLTAPTTTLDVEGTVSYKHTAFTTAGPTDNVDVSDTTVLEVDTSGGHVTIGGFTGGVQGQILYVLKTTTDLNRVILEHNEGGGSQDIYLATGANASVSLPGGLALYCNGSDWFALNK